MFSKKVGVLFIYYYSSAHLYFHIIDSIHAYDNLNLMIVVVNVKEWDDEMVWTNDQRK